eukprot:CAMPEP_0170583012 /NCGR_PEP_ID=MMETSP0224-20130122/7898_1 /TAXON_ID=285029 /ORGANISM="Togula jolla, Strain CCCM 725" /LENGTH=280 /DNA_ID=CAMNT_0010906291 /DNA_START=1 /DNA_END=843 /DNA_ORIENTATION=-
MAHADFTGKFKHPVRFNGTDFVETRLSEEEQSAEVSKLLAGSLHVFLERYGALLHDEDLRAIASTPAAAAPEVSFWLERLLRAPPSSSTLHKQKRRRRWMWARKEMAMADGFFSEEAMKHRDPSLFHHTVGRHLEPSERLSAPVRGNLTGYLLRQMDLECEADDVAASSAAGPRHGAKRGRSNDDADADACSADELEGDAISDFSVSSADGGAEAGKVDMELGPPDDAAVRRARFLKAMRDRFIDGREAGFDYSTLDADSDLDDVVELGRDAEERYFEND